MAGVEEKEQIMPDKFQNQVPCMNPAVLHTCTPACFQCGCSIIETQEESSGEKAPSNFHPQLC